MISPLEKPRFLHGNRGFFDLDQCNPADNVAKSQYDIIVIGSMNDCKTSGNRPS